MSLDAATREQIEGLIGSDEVVLFMKGNRAAPQCGFSATVIRILDGLIPEYATVDVLSEPSVREGIKTFSAWPTIPQLYVRGEFVGGCDIIQELYASGELHESLGVGLASVSVPDVSITEAAAEGLREALAGADAGAVLHLSIDAEYQNALQIGPPGARDVVARAGDLEIHMAPLSAQRADGVRIDVVDSHQGRAFRIANPNAPETADAAADGAGKEPGVGELSVTELKQRLDAGERFMLLDVRTPEERATASIDGARLITAELAEKLESLPPDTMLVFHCHHGGRSRAAAEHFAARGFHNVWNVTGGIDAWSREVDPSVPRY